MDGTLTVAIHDFDAIRATLGLPPGQPILEAIAELPAEKAEPLRRRLDEIEFEIAAQAKPQAGAADLLAGLKQRGAQLGILTRNARHIACETLRVCGLLKFFERDCILGRESAIPKPDSDGIVQLLTHWGAEPHDAVMVGDYRFDLEAGRQAGTATVYLDVTGRFPWRDYADVCIQDLTELLALAV